MPTFSLPPSMPPSPIRRTSSLGGKGGFDYEPRRVQINVKAAKPVPVARWIRLSLIGVAFIVALSVYIQTRAEQAKPRSAPAETRAASSSSRGRFMIVRRNGDHWSAEGVTLGPAVSAVPGPASARPSSAPSRPGPMPPPGGNP